MIDRKNKFNRPRWYARDVQARVGEILGRAPEAGGVRGAMVAFLEARRDKLPEGTEPAAAVETILRSVDAFAVANEEGRTSEDVRKALQESVAEMSDAQALAFLTALESAFRACDAQGATGSRIPSAEVLSAQIRQALDGASPDALAARIDALAALIEGDSLKAYVFATGNEELKDAILEGDVKETVDPEVAERLHEAIANGTGKADAYAATACAVYGMVLEGKVPGLEAKDVNVEVMTALVVAGQEKASVLTRLARGEIDAELAHELLEALGRALKWILVKALQAAVVVGTFVSAAVTVGAFGWAAYAGPILLISLIVGVTAAMSMGEDFEEVVDVLVELAEAAFALVGSGLKWVWDKVAGVAETAPETVRSAAFAAN